MDDAEATISSAAAPERRSAEVTRPFDVGPFATSFAMAQEACRRCRRSGRSGADEP